jgi:hypothetical protein
MSEQHKIKASSKRMEMVDAATHAGHGAGILSSEAALDDHTEERREVADNVGAGNPTEDPSEAATRPWHLMDNAPQDGTMIEVKEDPEDPDVSAVMVRYYHTSVRDRARRKWVPTAWWRNALTAERLSFEPFCWRMPDGFTQPGMIVA